MDNGRPFQLQRCTRVKLESGEKLAVALARHGVRIYQVRFGFLWARKLYETHNFSELGRRLYGRTALWKDDLMAEIVSALQRRRNIAEVRWWLRTKNGSP